MLTVYFIILTKMACWSLPRLVPEDLQGPFVFYAYARKHGAIGWGVIKNPNSYKLLKPGAKEDILNGHHLHRLNIDWKFATDKIEDAVKPADLIEKYGIFHPRSTCVKVNSQNAKKLIADMK